ncbi:MAG: glycosyltransferase [Phycisphaerales bacterium]|nr:glycosyltransferase [Phycisphaerales bacterium]
MIGLSDWNALPMGGAVWFWVLLLIAFVWLRRHADLNRGQRDHALTADDARRAPGFRPKVTMIVAGKEEEANIAQCVQGMLGQDYPGLQVIAVNDRSVDRTGAILDEMAARSPRLEAVHIRHLPEGWFGKNNAMRAGLERATGEWFCFTDADCKFDSRSLVSAAVGYAGENNIDFLSVLPKLEAETFWERVVQPVAGGILIFWNPPQKVNSPNCKQAYANGAFMLMSRRAYDALGGHDAVKATLNEDMHMARRAKQLGIRLHVMRNADMYRCRMYTGFRQIWRGWSRIFYGSFGTLPRLIISFLFLAIFSVSPYVALLTAGFVGSWGDWLAIAGAAAVASQQSILWRYYDFSGIPGRWALTYPLGAVLCLGMICNAMLRVGGATRTVWRGTTYVGGSQTTQGSAVPSAPANVAAAKSSASDGMTVETPSKQPAA